MARGTHVDPKSWHLLSLAACFRISAASAAAPTDTLASFRMTGVRGEVTLTPKAAGMQLELSCACCQLRSGTSTAMQEVKQSLISSSNNIRESAQWGSGLFIVLHTCEEVKKPHGGRHLQEPLARC